MHSSMYQALPCRALQPFTLRASRMARIHAEQKLNAVSNPDGDAAFNGSTWLRRQILDEGCVISLLIIG